MLLLSTECCICNINLTRHLQIHVPNRCGGAVRAFDSHAKGWDVKTQTNKKTNKYLHEHAQYSSLTKKILLTIFNSSDVSLIYRI